MKKYFGTITLFTILSFLLLTALIIVAISRQPEELKGDVLFKIFTALLIIIAVDIVMKMLFKLKNKWLWILQVFLLLAAIYVWIVAD